MFSKKRLKIDDNERVMVVAQDTKTNTKKILWHSNDKIYGNKVINKANGLYIIGTRRNLTDEAQTYTSVEYCLQSIVPTGYPCWGTVCSDKPCIIYYAPKNVYTSLSSKAIDSSKVDVKQPLYDLYICKDQQSSISGASYNGFELFGDGSGMTFDKLKPFGTLSSTLEVISGSSYGLTHPLLSTGDGKNLIINTTSGKFPDGNVVAMVYIEDNPGKVFENMPWHFHIGPYASNSASGSGNFGIALNTYNKSSLGCSYVFPSYKLLNEEMGKSYTSEEQVTYDDARSYVPLKNTWYEMYFDPTELVVYNAWACWPLNPGDYTNTSNTNIKKYIDGSTYTSGTKFNWYTQSRILKLRKATQKHIDMWCDSDSIKQTEANVEYCTDKIDYEFWINTPVGKQTTTMTVQESSNLKTTSSILNETYSTPLDATNEQKTFGYYYYPNTNLINEIELKSNNQTIFNVNNPINIVYYSGCNFIQSPTLKMPPYIPSIGLDVIGLASTTDNSALGQGVISEGDSFMKYTGVQGELPMVNWGPTDVYNYLGVYNTEASANTALANANPKKTKIIKSGAGSYYAYYVPQSRVYITNNGNCFEYGGPNSTPSGITGYHWVGTDRKSAITDETRKIDASTISTGPMDGRVIGYFRFDSRMDIEVFKKNANTYIDYSIHWHAYINSNADWTTDAPSGNIAIPYTDIATTTTIQDGYAKIYTYSKNNDGTYNFTSKSQNDERPKLDRWYAIIIDPEREKSMGTLRGKTGSVVDSDRRGYLQLMEIYDNNGLLKEEHRDYIGKSMAERYCKFVDNTYTFTIVVNGVEYKWSCNNDTMRTYFEKNGDVINLIYKDELIKDHPECVFKPTSNVCVNIEKSSNKKNIYNSSNPIYIPEMSGLTFVNI